MSLILSTVLCLSFAVPAFAQESPQVYSEVQNQAIDNLIEEYSRLYEANNQDSQVALEQPISNNESLEIVDYNVAYGYIIDGEMVLLDQQLYVSANDLRVTDSIVHDSDYGTYVFLADWNWVRRPTGRLEPWDMVGFSTQNGQKLSAREIIVRGYDYSGNRIAYYNTMTGGGDGFIQKGDDTIDGTAFWINDQFVVSGQMSAPLTYTLPVSAKCMLKYGHSWTNTSITGIGGSVDIRSGGGFNISWDTGVESLPIITSPGSRIPGQ